MSSPKISVIVPVFNVEKYIIRCIDSIMGQTFTDFEIIIVDDCSPCQSSVLIQKKYSAVIGTRIRLIRRRENGGLGAARNTGMEASRAPFIFFLDSDDWLAPTALDKLVAKQEETGADLIVADYFLATDSYSFPAATFRAIRSSKSIRGHILNYNPGAWNKLYKKELFLKSGWRFPEEKQWYEDLATTPFLVNEAELVEYVDEPLIHYYQRPDSIMGTARVGSVKLFDIFKTAQRLIDGRKKFSRNDWMEFEQNLIFHCGPARLNEIIAIDNPFKRYRFMKRLERELNERLPVWKYSSVMDQYPLNHKRQLSRYQECFRHFKAGRIFRSWIVSFFIRQEPARLPKIFFAIPTLEIGGAEKVFCNLLNLLERNLLDVTVYVYDRSGPMAEQLPKTGISVIYRKSRHSELFSKSLLQVLRSKEFKLPDLFWKLKVGAMTHLLSREYAYRKYVRPYSELNHAEFDHAICFTELHLDMNNFVLNHVNASKKSVWIHNDFDRRFIDYIDEASFNDCFSKFDHVVAVSSGAAKSIRGRFPGLKEKVAVINNIIDTEEIRKKSEELFSETLEADQIHLLSVGRLDLHTKGFDRLLPVLKQLMEDGFRFKWHLVGDGPGMADLRKLILEYELQDLVELYGARKNPYPFMKAVDAVLVPSRFEAYPTVVLEAHCLGTPCLVAENAGTADQFQNLSGIIMENSASGIYDGLRTYLSDATIRTKLRRELANYTYPNQKCIASFYRFLGMEINANNRSKSVLVINAEVSDSNKDLPKEVAI